MALEVDVAQRHEIEAALAKVVTRYGRLDIMVNNAAITRPARTPDVSEALWESVIGVNLSGVFWGCQAAFRYMGEAGYGRNSYYFVNVVAGIRRERVLRVEQGRGGHDDALTRDGVRQVRCNR